MPTPALQQTPHVYMSLLPPPLVYTPLTVCLIWDEGEVRSTLEMVDIGKRDTSALPDTPWRLHPLTTFRPLTMTFLGWRGGAVYAGEGEHSREGHECLHLLSDRQPMCICPYPPLVYTPLTKLILGWGGGALYAGDGEHRGEGRGCLHLLPTWYHRNTCAAMMLFLTLILCFLSMETRRYGSKIGIRKFLLMLVLMQLSEHFLKVINLSFDGEGGWFNPGF